MGAILRAAMGGAMAASVVSAQSGARISISGVSAQELSGNGTSQMMFTVTVTRDTTVAAGQISVQFQGSSGTATVGTSSCQPGIDVVLQPSALTIFANQTRGTIAVTLCADNMDEADSEDFTVSLFGAVGATITTDRATGTVLDDDAAPSLSVQGGAATEGGAGAAGVVSFTVRLNNASSRAVTFNAATQGGGATGGAACTGNIDFVTVSGSFTIAAGQTTVQVPVTNCADQLYEGNETYALAISNAQNATITTSSATGTITEDDPIPGATFGNGQNLQVTEGNAGTTQGSVQVTPTAAAAVQLTASVQGSGTATAGNTCAAGVDIVFSTATLTWAPGDVSPRTVAWQVCGDTRDDDDTETWTLSLRQPNGTMAFGQGSRTVVITDDDATPTLSVEDAGIARPAAQSSASVTLTVRLSAVSNRQVTLNLATVQWSGRRPSTVPGTMALTAATSGPSCSASTDYIKTTHALTLAPGATTATMDVTVCGAAGTLGGGGRLPATAAEVFEGSGFNATNATFARPNGYVLISTR